MTTTAEKILLAHGAGGKLGHDLLDKIILPELGNPILNELHDGAQLPVSGNIAFTTDSYVVQPLFFRGGNIGKLSVCGTVNDLSMTGAIPRFLSIGVIIEEGFPMDDLRKIVRSVKETAAVAGVAIVTGDTKVVERGKCDGIFINTAGIGELIPGSNISPRNVTSGMKVILSGCIGDHAACLLGARHGLDIGENLTSDCAPLNRLTQKMLSAVPQIAVMRDPTRGGVAAVLNEIAVAAKVGILLDEEKIPVREEVRGVCDLLGFDVLQLANEGKVVAFVPSELADKLLEVMHSDELGKDAAIIGQTQDTPVGTVGIKTALGSIRVVDMPMADIVPRIC